MSENRCYYLTPDHHLELRVEDVPSPGTGEVLIKIAANGICRIRICIFIRAAGWGILS